MSRGRAPALVALLLAACARQDPEPAPSSSGPAASSALSPGAPLPAATAGGPSVADAPSPLLRGVLVMSTENARLTPCDGAALDLLDRTNGTLGRVYSDLASQDTGEMFVELRGEQRAEAFVAAAIVRALPMGGTPCRDALAADEIRAVGDEPFWAARVTASGITWEAPDLPAPLAFPAVAPVAAGTARTWTTSADGHALELTVQDGECRGPSAAFYGLSAKVVLDGRSVTGCAFSGS